MKIIFIVMSAIIVLNGCVSHSGVYRNDLRGSDNKIQCSSANLVKYSTEKGVKTYAYTRSRSGGGKHYYVYGDKNRKIAKNIIKACASNSWGGNEEKYINHALRHCAAEFKGFKIPVHPPSRSYEIGWKYLSCVDMGLKNKKDAFNIYRESKYAKRETTKDKYYPLLDNANPYIINDIFDENHIEMFYKIIAKYNGSNSTHFDQIIAEYTKMINENHVKTPGVVIAKLLNVLSEKIVSDPNKYKLTSTFKSYRIVNKFNEVVTNEAVLDRINENFYDSVSIYYGPRMRKLSIKTRLNVIDSMVRININKLNSKHKTLRKDLAATNFATAYKSKKHEEVVIWGDILRKYGKMNNASLQFFEAEAYYKINLNAMAKKKLDRWLDLYGKNNKWYRKVISLYNRM